MDRRAKITVVIVNYRTPQESLSCLRSLAEERQQLRGLKVILVDGYSNDGSELVLREHVMAEQYREWVTLMPLAVNGGFAYANNQAMLQIFRDRVGTDFVFFLNPDAHVRPGAIVRLLALMEAHPECGVAGSQIVSADGVAQRSANYFPSWRTELCEGANAYGFLKLLNVSEEVAGGPSREVEWVSGASFLVRSSALFDAGLFDDGFFLYFEEVELLWRIRQRGWTIWYEPASVVIHEGGAATGIHWEKKIRRPFYWYQSRRRLLIRLYGPMGAYFCLMAWLAGRGLWFLRRTLRPSLRRRETACETRDMIRAWLAPLRFDRTSFARTTADPPGQPPAWLSRESLQ